MHSNVFPPRRLFLFSAIELEIQLIMAQLASFMVNVSTHSYACASLRARFVTKLINYPFRGIRRRQTEIVPPSLTFHFANIYPTRH